MKAIELANKKYGEGSAFLLGSSKIIDCYVYPTGSFKLDEALGVGGFPQGRIVEIYGPESAGKTTICQHVIAEAQKMGATAAFIDVEHALDPDWAQVCGVDIDNLIVSQPDSGEQALDLVEIYARSGEVDVIVVDSVAALVPKAEIEGEMGDAHMGLTARLMSQAMRKLAGVIKDNNVLVIFTNQIRMKIGVMFGSPETTSGGQALKFYASVRLDVRRGQQIKEGEDVVGNIIKVTIKKNKVAPPFKVTNLDIYYDEGISFLSELIHYALEFGIIKKGGAGWFTISEDQKVQGMKNLRSLLIEKPEVLSSVENLIRDKLGLPQRR